VIGKGKKKILYRFKNMIPDRANDSEEKPSADEDEHNSRAISLKSLSLAHSEKSSDQDGVDDDCQHSSPVIIHETTTSSARDKPPLINVNVGGEVTRNTPIANPASTDQTATIESNNSGEYREEKGTSGTISTLCHTDDMNECKTNQDGNSSRMQTQNYYKRPTEKKSLDCATSIAAPPKCSMERYDEEVDFDDEIANNDALIAYSEENNRKLQDRISKLNEAMLSIKKYQSVKSGRNMLREYGLKVELEALHEDIRFLKSKQEGLSETLFDLHLQRLDLIQLEEEQQQENDDDDDDEQRDEEKDHSISHSARNLEDGSNDRSTTFHSTISNANE